MEQLINQNPWLFWLIVILLLWSLPWKAMALWRSAKNDQKIWFVIFIIFNSVGVLEIVYLLFFGTKKKIVEENKEEKNYSTSDSRPASPSLGGPIV